MTLRLRHIEIFVAVCLEDGSITKAVNRLHISQPTVSVAIQEMEAHYGKKLFDRFSNRLYITPFGQSIYNRSLSLLNLYDDMVSADQSTNVVRVGTGTAIGKLLMPAVVSSFMKLHPDIQLQIQVSESTRLYHEVMENELDFVIAETVDDISGLSHRVIQQYPVLAICHKNNPLAAKEVVTAEELAAENLLLRERGSYTRYVVDMYFAHHGLKVSPLWESYSVQTLLNAANAEIGVAFLSLDHLLSNKNTDLVILNVPDFHGDRYVNVCYHKDKYFTPPMEEFLRHYQACSDEVLAQGYKLYTQTNPTLSKAAAAYFETYVPQLFIVP